MHPTRAQRVVRTGDCLDRAGSGCAELPQGRKWDADPSLDSVHRPASCEMSYVCVRAVNRVVSAADHIHRARCAALRGNGDKHIVRRTVHVERVMHRYELDSCQRAVPSQQCAVRPVALDRPAEHPRCEMRADDRDTRTGRRTLSVGDRRDSVHRRRTRHLPWGDDVYEPGSRQRLAAVRLG